MTFQPQSNEQQDWILKDVHYNKDQQPNKEMKIITQQMKMITKEMRGGIFCYRTFAYS
jgi:hypothetical protein